MFGVRSSSQYYPTTGQLIGAELRAFVAGYGALSPLVFIGFQAAQLSIAPITGQITAFVSDYLFGGILRTIYDLIGVTIGSAIAFWFPVGMEALSSRAQSKTTTNTASYTAGEPAQS